MRLLHGAAAFVLALLLLAGAAGAETVLPADFEQRLTAIVAETAREAARDRQVYGGVGNPQLASRMAARAQARADAAITRVVLAAVAERPAAGPAIVERAAALAPASAPGLRAAVRSAYPHLVQPDAAAVGLPAQWYPQRPGGPRTASAAPAGPVAPLAAYAAPAGEPLPMTWYDQPRLRRYGALAQAPAPAGPPLAAASAAPDLEAVEAVWDPLEGLNRVFHAFNRGIDFILLRPVAWTYSFVPVEIKGMVRNALFNLREPLNFANSLLQGEVTYAAQALGRFVVNSSFGIGGLADAAEPVFGWAPSRADFGQTLYVWGLGAGPYIEAPLRGPSNSRDLVGSLIDGVADPFNYIIFDGTAQLVIKGASIVSGREEVLEPLDELEKSSIDFYIALREASQVRRKVELNRGRPQATLGGPATDQLFDAAK